MFLKEFFARARKRGPQHGHRFYRYFKYSV